MENYMLETGNAICEMRLIAEGAVKLWEEEAQPVIYLVPKNERCNVGLALDAIATAVYTLRHRLRQLQEDHHNEVVEQDKAAVKNNS